MMQLITDRTQADVLLGTAKGNYGAADLNRVEQAVAELVTLAKGLDIRDKLVVKTDWVLPGGFSTDQWPTRSQMQRYLGNVAELCRVVAVNAELPVSMNNLTFEGANQIEKALEQVYDRIQKVLQIFQFSGEVFAGEENRI